MFYIFVDGKLLVLCWALVRHCIGSVASYLCYLIMSFVH